MKTSKKIAFFALSLTSLCSITAGIAASAQDPTEQAIACPHCGKGKGNKLQLNKKNCDKKNRLLEWIA